MDLLAHPLLNILNGCVRSLLSLAVVGVGMNAQAVVEYLPTWMAPWAGLCGWIWVLPTLIICLISGIFRVPSSWSRLIVNILQAQYAKQRQYAQPKEDEDIDTLRLLLNAALTIWQATVFRPFPCPEAWKNKIPSAFQQLFFRDVAAVYPPFHATTVSRDEEYWIYVNDMATTRLMAETHTQQIYDLFGRPRWLCYNPTGGFMVDLLECAVEKVGVSVWISRPRAVPTRALHRVIVKAATGHYRREVLVAHS